MARQILIHQKNENGMILKTVQDLRQIQRNSRPLNYNILADDMATQSQYGYVPERVLSWPNRRAVILDEHHPLLMPILCVCKNLIFQAIKTFSERTCPSRDTKVIMRREVELTLQLLIG